MKQVTIKTGSRFDCYDTREVETRLVVGRLLVILHDAKETGTRQTLRGIRVWLGADSDLIVEDL